jgi:hypothetical protein
MDDLSIRFGYEGEVSLKDSEEILQEIKGVHSEVVKAANSAKLPQRKEALFLSPKIWPVPSTALSRISFNRMSRGSSTM